jgi:hypothetical protein
MKRTLPIFFILCAILFSCRPHTENTVHKKLVERMLEGESIDTLDCDSLVTMETGYNGDWEYAAYIFPLQNEQKQYASISLKRDNRVRDLGDALSFICRLGRQVCVDDKAPVFFTFTDSSKLEAQSISNNCFGDYNFAIYANPNGTESSTDSVNYNTIFSKKIHSISFTTHDGHRDFVLNDIQANNLWHIISCLHNAK